MKNKLNKYKGLKDRTKQMYESRDGTTFMNAIKKPGGVDFYKPDKGRNEIDIIPYIVKSDRHPVLQKGDGDYVLDFWVHRNVGAGEAEVVCLKNTYKKPCPICEEVKRLRGSGNPEDDEAAKALKSTRRVAYNVLDKSGDLKLFVVSHFLFEKELLDEAGASEDGELITFADPDDGRVIKFRAVVGSLSDKYFDFKSFSFEKRDSIDEDILKEALSLDELLEVFSYDELYNILHSVEAEIETESEEEKEDENEDENEDQKNSRKRKRKRTREKTKFDCPNGYKFGTDYDTKDECDDCAEDMWDKCADACDKSENE